MQIILLERIPGLGQIGDEVRVKNGYARNFLLPQKKALRSSAENRAYFENRRAELEARDLERKKEAEAVREKIDETSYVVIRSAGETGQLYGSVSSRDVAATLEENGIKLARTQVILNQPIKTLGLHAVSVRLHAEVEATITVNVARSEDEAERQAAGEDLTARRDEDEEEEALATPAAEEIFEEGAAPQLEEETQREQGDSAEVEASAEESAADESPADESAPEESTPEESAPDESAPDKSASTESASEESAKRE